MQKVLTAEQMREVDRLTTERYGIPSILLMENAAHAVARVITEKLGGSVKGKSILVLCGKGNNGGDGAAVARLMVSGGASVEVLLFGMVKDCAGDARTNFEICKSLAGVEPVIVNTRHPEIFRDSDLFSSGGSLSFYEVTSREVFDELLYNVLGQDWDCTVDAVFGTGLARPMAGWIGNVVHHIKILNDTQVREFGMKRVVLSIDVPSGLGTDLGEPVGINSIADVTVTFTAPKAANVIPTASRFNGELIIADIGSPQELVDAQPSQLYLADKEDAANWLKKTAFSSSDYKNKRGHAMLIAGSDDYTGAAVLCGNSAMRSGAGLVTLCVPESCKTEIASRVLPEVMVRGVAETENGAISEAAFGDLGELLDKVDAVAIGSGISQDESTRAFVKMVVEGRRQPMIIDADALNLLSPFAANSPPAHAGGSGLILTPHEGEFLRLLGREKKNHPVGETPPPLLSKEGSPIGDRVAAVREFAVKNNVILVLKGERVLIGAPDGRVVVNPTGNSGLGKAGNGDTLTGILVGFTAQAVKFDIDIFETVVAAVYVAGMAGDVAERKYGKRVMTASDVREWLVEVFAEFEEPE